jgi:CO/xanthine dehydrogenase Mo-binding subunit
MQHPCHQEPAVAVEVAASDMGPGTYTSMTQVAAETLGLAIEQVNFRLGRSDYPPASVASSTRASPRASAPAA